MFIKYEAEVSSRVGGGERGVVDFGKLFTETNEQKFTPVHIATPSAPGHTIATCYSDTAATLVISARI